MSYYTFIDTPLGNLVAFAQAGGICGLYYPQHRRGRLPLATDQQDDAPFRELARQLVEYFAGQRTAFDLELQPCGTQFSRRVWGELSAIAYGTTATYADIAARLGPGPQAARAVGGAVGRNPISIVVPCHRVVGAGGALTGYAGGMPAKRFLLGLESGKPTDRSEVAIVPDAVRRHR